MSTNINTSKNVLKQRNEQFDVSEFNSTELETLLEEKQRQLANLAEEKRALLSEGECEEDEDEIIMKIDEKKKNRKSRDNEVTRNQKAMSTLQVNKLNSKKNNVISSAIEKNSQLSEGECEDDEGEIITKIDDIKKCRINKYDGKITNAAKSIPPLKITEKNYIKNNITPNKILDHQDGLLTTKEFLGNWSAASFSQYKTPPPKTNRNRADSETSANNMDFASAEGIRALLKGKLVPGSYVSPQSGMLIFIF